MNDINTALAIEIDRLIEEFELSQAGSAEQLDLNPFAVMPYIIAKIRPSETATYDDAVRLQYQVAAHLYQIDYFH